jgi:hypothetical protein
VSAGLEHISAISVTTYKDYGQNKTTDMKTEPIDAMRERIKELFEITAEDVTAIEANARRNEIIALAAFKKGQSSPKIKQLEWDETSSYYFAESPVGNYTILRVHDFNKKELCRLYFNGRIMVCDIDPDEAKAVAQAEFEKRVMECLDL